MELNHTKPEICENRGNMRMFNYNLNVRNKTSKPLKNNLIRIRFQHRTRINFKNQTNFQFNQYNIVYI
ncbi:hypothetical protein BLOT_010187 [Blomia tropicalis]|nr:hypothetical protein BLOT_010187 [Blomia tropicalis]